MINDSQKQKIIEALGEGTMGTSTGVLGGWYFAEHAVTILVLGVIGAVLGKVLFPILVDKILKLLLKKKKTIPTIRLKKLIALVFIFLFLIGFSYLTVDTYTKGQKLYTTERVKCKEQPGVGGKHITIFEANTEVTYVQKGWRRIRLYEGEGSFFSFWRKVRGPDGRIGWVYGGYLTAHNNLNG